LQVIASVFVLSAGLTGALSLVVGAMQANRTHAERLTASHLAAEGLEAMRNLRDTNYLLYPDKPDACWNFWSDNNHNGIVGDDPDCTENATGQNDTPWNPAPGDPPPAGNGSEYPKMFIVDPNLDNMTWNLISETDFDLNTAGFDYDDGFWLYQKTLESGVSFYTHNRHANAGEEAQKTQFQRSIALYYIDAANPAYSETDGDRKNGFFPSGFADQDDRILVISRVWWSSGGINHQVVLSELLADTSSAPS
jgi:hypothetical protein